MKVLHLKNCRAVNEILCVPLHEIDFDKLETKTRNEGWLFQVLDVPVTYKRGLALKRLCKAMGLGLMVVSPSMLELD